MEFQLFANQSVHPHPQEISRAAFISDTLNETLSEHVSVILSAKIAVTCQSGSLQEGLQCACESMRSAQRSTARLCPLFFWVVFGIDAGNAARLQAGGETSLNTALLRSKVHHTIFILKYYHPWIKVGIHIKPDGTEISKQTAFQCYVLLQTCQRMLRVSLYASDSKQRQRQIRSKELKSMGMRTSLGVMLLGSELSARVAVFFIHLSCA